VNKEAVAGMNCSTWYVKKLATRNSPSFYFTGRCSPDVTFRLEEKKGHGYNVIMLEHTCAR